MPNKDMLDLLNKIKDYHRELGIPLENNPSPLAGDQFSGEFNVSGFHKKILELPKKEGSFFGIDRCLRLKESLDNIHSYSFHMGIFAESVNLERDYSNPFEDKRFGQLQERIISQFMRLLSFLGMNPNKLEATYLEKITFGSTNKGRDSALKKHYSFPTDVSSRDILKKYKIKVYPLPSISSIDIRPMEGALVGPRVEIAYRGIEIATIVFNCFKIENGKLIPINYVGGYAIGIERLLMILEKKTSLIEIKEYKEIFNKLIRYSPVAESSIMKPESLVVIFGLEAIKLLNGINDLSKKQKDVLRNFKRTFDDAGKSLGLTNDDLRKMSH